VLAFPADVALAAAVSPHHDGAADQTGQYRIRGLPPGEHYLATVDPSQQGEWFEPAYLDEHRGRRRPRVLSEGDVKTKDFTVSLK
jgi:hypothetical protein